MTLHFTNARLIDPETLQDAPGSLTVAEGVITARDADAHQVEMGVAVRMACMDLLARNLRAERGARAVGAMV